MRKGWGDMTRATSGQQQDSLLEDAARPGGGHLEPRGVGRQGGAPATEEGDFPFTLPDRGALWMRLALNASQVANLCGVTLRQVIHWADRGYLPRSPHDSSAFTGQAVDM